MSSKTEYGLVELLMTPLVYLLGSCMCLNLFNGLISFLKYASSKAFAKSGLMFAQHVHEGVVAVKPYLDRVLPTAPFPLTLNDIILGALLMVAVGMWQTQYLTKKAVAKNGENCKTACKPAAGSKKTE